MPNPDDLEQFYNQRKEDSALTPEQNEELNKQLEKKMAEIQRLTELAPSSVYAVVSIGNTDNKLSQQQWHDFVADVTSVLNHYGKIHFFGGSPNWEWWQNVAWIIECRYVADISNFSVALEAIRKRYEQDSIFVLRGSPKFI